MDFFGGTAGLEGVAAATANHYFIVFRVYLFFHNFDSLKSSIGNILAAKTHISIEFFSISLYLVLAHHLGRLAQPVEQLTLNQRVAGSIPASPIDNSGGRISRLGTGILILDGCAKVCRQDKVRFLPALFTQDYRDGLQQDRHVQ